jgi:hypothetical protein
MPTGTAQTSVLAVMAAGNQRASGYRGPRKRHHRQQLAGGGGPVRQQQRQLADHPRPCEPITRGAELFDLMWFTDRGTALSAGRQCRSYGVLDPAVVPVSCALVGHTWRQAASLWSCAAKPHSLKGRTPSHPAGHGRRRPRGRRRCRGDVDAAGPAAAATGGRHAAARHWRAEGCACSMGAVHSIVET